MQPCAAAAVPACFRRASSSCLFIGRSSRREDYQTDAAEKTAGTVRNLNYVGWQRCQGYYLVESNVVTVTYASRRASRQIGGSTAQLVAGSLLRELVHAKSH